MFLIVKCLIQIFPVVAERPQHMLMRVSVGIHKGDIDAAIETYNLLSEKWFTHASPTLFNAGTNVPQLSRQGLKAKLPQYLTVFKNVLLLLI